MKIALSVGCPCGIGPEVAVVAAAQARFAAQIVLVGDRGAILDAAELRGVDLTAGGHIELQAASTLAPEARRPGAPGPQAGRAQLAAVDQALDLVLEGHAQALVTGPVSKHAITLSGRSFVGHTEHLQARTHSGRVVMLFAGPRLRTSLVTTHLALANVPAAITVQSVQSAIVLTAEALLRDYGLSAARVAVTGLNPHAGEEGLFGTEEREAIAPAIAAARAALGARVTLSGPIGAETAYRQARDGAWDAVVAMYHDQATIAAKLLDFGEAVNVTLGLPIVRTSVDHGTGYDIAGLGQADPAGMRAAIEMAFAIVARKARV